MVGELRDSASVAGYHCRRAAKSGFSRRSRATDSSSEALALSFIAFVPWRGQGNGSRARARRGPTRIAPKSRRSLVRTRYTWRRSATAATVAEIILPDGRSLNEEMVKAGLAWWYRQYAPGDERLRQLEAAARSVGLGLWADATPVQPWEWRKNDARAQRDDTGGRRQGVS